MISDIHGNMDALDAILGDARGFDDIVFLGDLVDYGPQPAEVIDILKSLGARGVRGNHDHAVGYNVDCRCGREIHWLSTWFRENYTLRLLSKNDIEYLRKLPVTLSMQSDHYGRVLLVHGSPRNNLYGYLYPWLDNNTMLRELTTGSRLSNKAVYKPIDAGLVLVGHTHYQFLRVISGIHVANPGSSGQPRDMDPRAAYMILDAETGYLEFRRVRYDNTRVYKKLEQMGVRQPYLEALAWLFLKASMPPKEIQDSKTY